MSTFQDMIYAEESKNREFIRSIEGTDNAIYMKQLIAVCEQYPDATVLIHYVDDITYKSMQQCNAIDSYHHTPIVIHPIKSIIANTKEIILTPLSHADFVDLQINFLAIPSNNFCLTANRIIASKQQDDNRWMHHLLFAEYIPDSLGWQMVENKHKIFHAYNISSLAILAEQVTYITPHY